VLFIDACRYLGMAARFVSGSFRGNVAEAHLVADIDIRVVEEISGAMTQQMQQQ
jgi:hypothetical protein